MSDGLKKYQTPKDTMHAKYIKKIFLLRDFLILTKIEIRFLITTKTNPAEKFSI